MPQVLLEAFAARLAFVATAVGGVAHAAGDCALLVPPGNAPAAAYELERIAHDRSLRSRLAGVAINRARRHTVRPRPSVLPPFARPTGRTRDPTGNNRRRREPRLPSEH